MLPNFKLAFLTALTILTNPVQEPEEGENLPTPNVFELDVVPYSHLGRDVYVKTKLTQTQSSLSLAGINLEVTFYDWSTKDEIYKFTGNLDVTSDNSIENVLINSGHFEYASLNIIGTLTKISELGCFNAYGAYPNKTWESELPLVVPTDNVDIYRAITSLDDTPNTLYMLYQDNLEHYMSMLRVATDLNVRLIVEFEPHLPLQTVLTLAEELNMNNHRVRFFWSPVLARPINAVGLNGAKVAREVGGYVLARHVLRDANKNTKGIPPLQTPIAGYDYPVSFIGMEQRKDFEFDDENIKKLADAKINVVRREKFPNGVRFIISDVLTAYKDNNSLLKVVNASDISMFIDNYLIQIVRRHMLKSIEETLEKGTTDAVEFLESCTTKDRKLLVHSEELGGYFSFSLTRKEDRPHDAVVLKCGYHTDGATRVAFLETAIYK